MSCAKKPARSHLVATTLTTEEFDKVNGQFKRTTCRSLAEFVRDRICRHPETVYYRNQSADEFLPIAISLRNELLAIGKELRQIIVKLQISQELPVIKAGVNELEAKLFAFDIKSEEIRTRLNQIYERWWQE